MKKVPAPSQNHTIRGMRPVCIYIHYTRIYGSTSRVCTSGGADKRLCNLGKEGAPPKEGMSGALEDTKKAASDAAAGQSL